MLGVLGYRSGLMYVDASTLYVAMMKGITSRMIFAV
jgi:hypothetical protein